MHTYITRHFRSFILYIDAKIPKLQNPTHHHRHLLCGPCCLHSWKESLLSRVAFATTSLPACSVPSTLPTTSDAFPAFILHLHINLCGRGRLHVPATFVRSIRGDGYRREYLHLSHCDYLPTSPHLLTFTSQSRSPFHITLHSFSTIPLGGPPRFCWLLLFSCPFHFMQASFYTPHLQVIQVEGVGMGEAFLQDSSISQCFKQLSLIMVVLFIISNNGSFTMAMSNNG